MVIKGDDLAEPELARAVAEKFLAMFDKIDDLQCEFRTTTRPADSKGLGQLQRWEDGFYAYKRGGYELLRYDETIGDDGPITYRYAMNAYSLRGFREDARYGSRTGAVRRASAMNFRLQWAPGHYLPLGFVNGKIREHLSGGQYVVRLPKGANGDPRLIAPVLPADRPQEKIDKRYLQSVVVLSRQQGMSPSKIEWYIGQEKQAETILNLFEAAPGIWLADHGTCKQLAGGQEGSGVDSEFWLQPASLKINSGLQVGFFNPEFPPGTRGMDHITKTEFAQGISGGQASDLKALSAVSRAIAPTTTDGQRSGFAAVPGWTGIDSIVAAFSVAVGVGGGLAIVLVMARSRKPRNVSAGTAPETGFRRYVR